MSTYADITYIHITFVIRFSCLDPCTIPHQICYHLLFGDDLDRPLLIGPAGEVRHDPGGEVTHVNVARVHQFAEISLVLIKR